MTREPGALVAEGKALKGDHATSGIWLLLKPPLASLWPVRWAFRARALLGYGDRAVDGHLQGSSCAGAGTFLSPPFAQRAASPGDHPAGERLLVQGLPPEGWVDGARSVLGPPAQLPGLRAQLLALGCRGSTPTSCRVISDSSRSYRSVIQPLQPGFLSAGSPRGETLGLLSWDLPAGQVPLAPGHGCCLQELPGTGGVGL